jgi:hypothetical protein
MRGNNRLYATQIEPVGSDQSESISIDHNTLFMQPQRIQTPLQKLRRLVRATEAGTYHNNIRSSDCIRD